MATKTAPTPKNWPLLHRAETLLLQGQYAQAVETFTEAITNIDIKNNTQLAWAYAHRGEAKRYLGDYGDAAEDFTAATKHNSGYAWAWAHWGETLRQNGDKAKARGKFDQAITLNPHYIWAIAHRAACYDFDAGIEADLEAAEKGFTEALNLNPNYAWAVAFRSVVYRYQGKKDPEKGCLAWAELLRAITLDSGIISADFYEYARQSGLHASVLGQTG